MNTQLLFDRITNLIPTMDGWCSVEKGIAMAKSIVENRPRAIVEIGVFGGRSLLAMAFACQHINHGHVYGIDPWTASAALTDMDKVAPQYEGECTDPDLLRKKREHEAWVVDQVKWWSEINYEEIYAKCIRHIYEQTATSVCTVFRTTSKRAGALLDEIDMLHIDGNHSEQASVTDVMTWLPKLTSGGQLWLDDCDGPYLATAIRLIEEQCNKLYNVGLCAVYRKR